MKEVKYSIKFPSCRHVDTGVYILKVKNKYGYGEDSARLDVYLKPEIDGLKDQSSEPGHQAVFETKIRANPKPKVTWTKNGENLSNAENCEIIVDVEKETYTLVVSDIAVSDGGEYVLTASNSQGETVSKVRLHLHVEKPEFVKVPTDQTIHHYSSMASNVRAKGLPRPTIKWVKDGQEVDVNKIDEVTKQNQIKTEYTSETEVTSDFKISHFRETDSGYVKNNFYLFKSKINFIFSNFSIQLLPQMLLGILKLSSI